MEKRRKKYKIILALGSIICFFARSIYHDKDGSESRSILWHGTVLSSDILADGRSDTLSILCHESTGMENDTSGNDGCLDSDSESDTSAAAIFPVLSMHYI